MHTWIINKTIGSDALKLAGFSPANTPACELAFATIGCTIDKIPTEKKKKQNKNPAQPIKFTMKGCELIIRNSQECYFIGVYM